MFATAFHPRKTHTSESPSFPGKPGDAVITQSQKKLQHLNFFIDLRQKSGDAELVAVACQFHYLSILQVGGRNLEMLSSPLWSAKAARENSHATTAASPGNSEIRNSPLMRNKTKILESPSFSGVLFGEI